MRKEIDKQHAMSQFMDALSHVIEAGRKAFNDFDDACEVGVSSGLLDEGGTTIPWHAFVHSMNPEEAAHIIRTIARNPDFADRLALMPSAELARRIKDGSLLDEVPSPSSAEMSVEAWSRWRDRDLSRKRQRERMERRRR